MFHNFEFILDLENVIYTQNCEKYVQNCEIKSVPIFLIKLN